MFPSCVKLLSSEMWHTGLAHHIFKYCTILLCIMVTFSIFCKLISRPFPLPLVYSLGYPEENEQAWSAGRPAFLCSSVLGITLLSPRGLITALYYWSGDQQHQEPSIRTCWRAISIYVSPSEVLSWTRVTVEYFSVLQTMTVKVKTSRKCRVYTTLETMM